MRTARYASDRIALRVSAVAVTLALVGAGCGMGPMGGSSDALDFAELARSVWTVESTSGYDGTTTPRIAIVEFTVEYAESDGDTPLDYGEGMRSELPSLLYEGFVDVLPQFGAIPVPLAELTASPAYERLRAAAPSELDADRRPVAGLAALGDDDATRAAISDVITESDLDGALQLRLRVGVRDGRAAIEKGSFVRSHSRNGVGQMRSRLALIGPLGVTEAAGDRSAVVSARFVTGIHRLFRPLVATALVSTGWDPAYGRVERP